MIERGFLIGGEERRSEDLLTVLSPHSREPVGKVSLAGPQDVEDAARLAVSAFEQTRELASYERERMLQEVSEAVAARKEELARTITLEAGKPIRFSRLEVERSAAIFALAAEEAKRIGGEVIPLDWTPATKGRMALYCRVPLGPVLGITPFNFPLNLVSHKAAPALAAGNTIVIRPSSATPLSALMLGEIIASCGWPKGAVSVVPCNTRLAEAMVADDRFRMLSFTGSPEVGWRLKEMAGRKRVALELGGNAATVVDETADVAYAATRCVTGAFAFSGQVCISVQRILVHEAVFEEFSQRFIQELSKLRFGDPMDEATDLGPMISEGAARRCEEWVEEAVKGGAKVLAGGKRERNFFQPTVLTGTMPEMKVNACEVFAPVVTLEPFSDFDKALAAANDGPYGLQAGVFTNDGRRIMRAFRGLDVGGVIVNDIPTLRLDHMPYGGVKLSGMGREGVRPAIEEMTEMRLLALNLG